GGGVERAARPHRQPGPSGHRVQRHLAGHQSAAGLRQEPAYRTRPGPDAGRPGPAGELERQRVAGSRRLRVSRRGDGGRVAPEPPFPSAREGAVAPERAHRPCVFVAHRRIRRALPGALLAAVRERALGSPLIGTSTLAGSFQGSRGFGVTFTGEGIPQLLERFGFLKPYWERVRAGPPERMLQSLRSRLSRPAPPP